MTTPLLDVTIKLNGSGDDLNVCLLGYQLELATAFGTSHSSSTFRNNALLLLRVPSSHSTAWSMEQNSWTLKGVGEVGLPPKKELVYEADLEDITTYVQSFLDSMQHLSMQHLCTQKETVPFMIGDVFADLAEPYFSLVRKSFGGGADGGDSSMVKSVLPYALLLHALDICSCNSPTVPFSRAGRALVESAILDAWASDLHMPLHELINVSPRAEAHHSFYTAALNDDISLIVSAAMFGAQSTPHLKIKLNSSVDLARAILAALNEALPHQSGHHWSIDANAAWSPEVAELMLREVLMPYKHRIFMVEQPFPVDVHMCEGEQSGGDMRDSVNPWVEVKTQYNACNILIFADESMRTADDVSLLAPFVNGVNIKLEKCGGFRGALLAVEEARAYNLLLWFGCMVGSNVNSTTTAHLFSLACGSDLDGALLVTPETLLFKGGFQYTHTPPLGSIQLPSKEEGCLGIGVTPTARFAEYIFCRSNCNSSS